MIVIGYHMILILFLFHLCNFVGFGGIVTFFLFLFLQYSEILGSGAFKTVYGSDTHLLLFFAFEVLPHHHYSFSSF